MRAASPSVVGRVIELGLYPILSSPHKATCYGLENVFVPRTHLAKWLSQKGLCCYEWREAMKINSNNDTALPQQKAYYSTFKQPTAQKVMDHFAF